MSSKTRHILEIKVSLIRGALPMQCVSCNCIYGAIGKKGVLFSHTHVLPLGRESSVCVCEVCVLLATQWRYSSLAGSNLGTTANTAVITSPVIFIS